MIQLNNTNKRTILVLFLFLMGNAFMMSYKEYFTTNSTTEPDNTISDKDYRTIIAAIKDTIIIVKYTSTCIKHIY